MLYYVDVDTQQTRLIEYAAAAAAAAAAADNAANPAAVASDNAARSIGWGLPRQPPAPVRAP